MFIYCPWFQICKPFIIFPKTAIFIIHYHIEWINCGLLRNATFHTRSRYLLWNLHLRLKYILKFRKHVFKNFDNLRKMIQREELYDVQLNSCEGLPGGVLVPLFPSIFSLCSHVPAAFPYLFLITMFYHIPTTLNSPTPLKIKTRQKKQRSKHK